MCSRTSPNSIWAQSYTISKSDRQKFGLNTGYQSLSPCLQLYKWSKNVEPNRFMFWAIILYLVRFRLLGNSFENSSLPLFLHIIHLWYNSMWKRDTHLTELTIGVKVLLCWNSVMVDWNIMVLPVNHTISAGPTSKWCNSEPRWSWEKFSSTRGV